MPQFQFSQFSIDISSHVHLIFDFVWYPLRLIHLKKVDIHVRAQIVTLLLYLLL